MMLKCTNASIRQCRYEVVGCLVSGCCSTIYRVSTWTSAGYWVLQCPMWGPERSVSKLGERPQLIKTQCPDITETFVTWVLQMKPPPVQLQSHLWPSPPILPNKINIAIHHVPQLHLPQRHPRDGAAPQPSTAKKWPSSSPHPPLLPKNERAREGEPPVWLPVLRPLGLDGSNMILNGFCEVSTALDAITS